MTPEDTSMSLNEVLQNAVAAEKQGVPVNWRDLAFTIYNVATQHIANLEKADPELPMEDEDGNPIPVEERE